MQLVWKTEEERLFVSAWLRVVDGGGELTSCRNPPPAKAELCAKLHARLWSVAAKAATAMQVLSDSLQSRPRMRL
jgi:hypothetical protein